MSTLRTQMTHAMIVRDLTQGTHKASRRAVTDLPQCAHRRPDQLSDRDVQGSLVHGLEERHLAWSPCNTMVHGLRFCSHVTLGQPTTTCPMPCAQPPSKRPVRLSRAEVAPLLAAAPTVRDRTCLPTISSAGLRVREALHLTLTASASQRLGLRMAQGTGRTDRSVPLSARFLPDLRTSWRTSRPAVWLGANHAGPPSPWPVRRPT